VTAAMMGPSQSGQTKSPEDRFWAWFTKNQDALYSFERNQEAIFNDLLHELHKVHRDLTFEFGPEINNQREFVISAGGVKNVFPAVISLANTAPALPKWKITKFRPRREEISTITIENVSVSPENVWFSIEQEGEKVNLILFLGNERMFDKNIHGSIGFLFLDQILGEYDVETFIGSIDFRPITDSPGMKKARLSELRSTFDTILKEKIN
jgi:hypothetical protein